MNDKYLYSYTNLSNKYSNLHLGENLHPEYNWSENLEERIIQFSYQLTYDGSKNKIKLKNLKNIYFGLIIESINIKKIKKELGNKYLLILYKLIAYTRDINNGKGLYNASYMMIASWNQLYIIDIKYKLIGLNLAYKAIENIVNDYNKKPLGSWKDIKYFCNYYKEEILEIIENPISENNLAILNNDQLICRIKNLVSNKLYNDEKSLYEKSLLAKWIPREKSLKFGWLTQILAENYYKNFLLTANKPEQIELAKKKCLTKFRILIANINKDLKTIQIQQCERKWSEINFEKNITSITLNKQSLAFQNISKKGEERNYKYEDIARDRKLCSKNYKVYINNCLENKKIIKAKNTSIVDLVKKAIDLNYFNNETERNLINLQWNEINKNIKENLTNFIPLIDTSYSMEDEYGYPLHSAIGLGLKIAELSNFGKRAITFSNTPEWINLDTCIDFVDCVDKIKKAPWGQNTNILLALELILNAAINQNIDPSELEKTTLVILSDMQIDRNNYNNTLDEIIKTKFEEAGLKSVYKKPYPVPHIIFWNLKSTHGFPTLSTNKNISMISGSTMNVLNNFLNKGNDFLKELDSWKILNDSINKSKYSEFENNFNEFYKYI